MPKGSVPIVVPSAKVIAAWFHVAFAQSFESNKYSNQIALIQINTILSTLPALVLIVELNQLPHVNSDSFEQIRLLFRLLFKPTCRTVNLQDDFKVCLEGNPPSCEECGYDGNDIYNRCNCRWLPYIGTDETWSIQNAIRFTSRLFLDKSYTRAEWGQLLDEDYSRIPKSRLRLLINYVAYDVLTASNLVNPVMEKWSYKEFSEASMTFLLTDTSSSTLTHTTTSLKIDKIKKNINDNTFKNVLNFLEPISDDELNGNEGDNVNRNEEDNVNGYGERSAGVSRPDPAPRRVRRRNPQWKNLRNKNVSLQDSIT
ncbi:unnamed protein product [Adineta steineri]|uniref:Uncharacterized protein n=1 Tax=Adineta steineri TaxID=433720 RepID=A0A814JD72_9BILA|nr:unnamed protein product [Adineta steineri]CAF1076616.1 unnamed protein product [Adineta steineri]